MGAALACLSGTCLAQWFDNFDSYASNAVLDGPGGWQGADHVNSPGSTSTAFARSGPNSLQTVAPNVPLRPFSGFDSGAWTFTAYQYIPSGPGNAVFFDLFNGYADSALHEISVQLHFNMASGMVYDDLLGSGGNPSPGSNQVPFVRDAWEPITVNFDLTANTYSALYNGAPIISGQWTRGSASAELSFQAVMLLTFQFSPAVYYDDMSLVPAPGGAVLLGLAGVVGAGRRRR